MPPCRQSTRIGESLSTLPKPSTTDTSPLSPWTVVGLNLQEAGPHSLSLKAWVLWVNPFRKIKTPPFGRNMKSYCNNKKAASQKICSVGISESNYTHRERCRRIKELQETANHIHRASHSQQRNAGCIHRRGLFWLKSTYRKRANQALRLPGPFHEVRVGEGAAGQPESFLQEKVIFSGLRMALNANRFPCRNDLWARDYTPFCSQGLIAWPTAGAHPDICLIK